MGCGKSSVGRELSGLLSWPFVDLDEYIESREGRSIRDIFESEGEAAFRKMELEALKEILLQGATSEHGQGTISEPGQGITSKLGDATRSETAEATDKASPATDRPQAIDTVLALGGGTLTTPECAELVSASTFCIYLKASPATLLAHLEHESATRPMLNPTDTKTSTCDAGTSTDNTETVMPQNSHPSSSKNAPSISLKAPGQLLLRRITALLSRREPVYEATARHTVSTDGLSINQIAAAISKLPNKIVPNYRTNLPQITEFTINPR